MSPEFILKILNLFISLRPKYNLSTNLQALLFFVFV